MFNDYVGGTEDARQASVAHVVHAASCPRGTGSFSSLGHSRTAEHWYEHPDCAHLEQPQGLGVRVVEATISGVGVFKI